MKKIMNSVNENYLLSLILIGFFCLYLLTGLHFTYKYDTVNPDNLFFEADIHRVFHDLTTYDFDHYRSSVHPLFMLLFFPIVRMMKILFIDPIVSVLIIQAILGTINIYLVKYILEKMNVMKSLKLLLIMIYGFSFSNLVFVGIPETFVFACFFLLSSWAYAFHLIGISKKLGTKEYMFLVLFGVTALAVTVTNIAHFCIILFIVLFYKHSEKSVIKNVVISFLKTLGIVLVSFVLTIGLANIQQAIFPATSNFFNYLIDFVKNKDHGERYYIVRSVSIVNITNVIKGMFLNNIISPNISIYNNMMWFDKMGVLSYFSLFIEITLFSYGLYSKIKLHKLKSDYVYICGFLLAILFNIGLHIFYGNEITFLYSQHFTFLIILLLGVLLKDSKSIVTISSLSLVLFVEIVSNLYAVFQMLDIIRTSRNLSHNFILIPYVLTILKAALVLSAVIIIWTKIRRNKPINDYNREED